MIYQITVFACELCHMASVRISEQAVYSDPLITFPKGEGWAYINVEGRGEVMACGTCVKNNTAEPDTAELMRRAKYVFPRGATLNYVRHYLGFPLWKSLGGMEDEN